MRICRLIVPLLVTWAAAPLWAQQPEDALTPLRGRTELNDEDRRQIRAFVDERIAAVLGEDGLAAREATEALRDAFTGTDAFKRAYAAVCVGAISVEFRTPEFKQAKVVPATRLITVLNTLKVVESQAVLLEALTDQRVAVRAAAALGLHGLRAQLARAGGGAYTSVLGALKEAGKREKSRDTLRAIYTAMNYAELPDLPDAKANIAAVLELLEQRAQQCAARKVTALGADDAGLTTAATLVNAMNEDERKRLTTITATMVKYAIEEYFSGERDLSKVRDSGGSKQLIEDRNGVERLIVVGEKLLRELLSPAQPPVVLDGLRKLDKSAVILQWQEWGKLLQTAVGQDFAVTVAPEPEPDKPGETGDSGDG